MSDVSRNERILVWLLRLGGIVAGSAFLAMPLPIDWMAETHEWLGLGEFPRAPLVEYLTRSIAAMYGFHGVLLLLVSCDLRRYRPIVFYLGVMNVLFGAMMLTIDLYAKLPMLWTLSEGPPIMAFGVVLLYLVRSVPRS